MGLRLLVTQRFADYVCSLRPWSFSSSLTPVLLGTVLAYKSSQLFSFVLLLVTCVTVLALHAAGNLVNTYYDFVRGVDSQKSDDRTLVDSKLKPEQVVSLGVFAYVIACIGLLLVILLCPVRTTTQMAHLAFVFFGGLTGSFLYTGGKFGLKYIALGDVLILIIFGPLSILFAYMAQSGTIDLITLKYAIPLALNTEAILHSNNTRDIRADKNAGLVTIPILIGTTCSHLLFALLLFVPYIIFTLLSLHYSAWFLLPMITLPSAFRIERDFRAKRLEGVPAATARLNIYLGLFYVTSLILVPSRQLPWLKIT